MEAIFFNIISPRCYLRLLGQWRTVISSTAMWCHLYHLLIPKYTWVCLRAFWSVLLFVCSCVISFYFCGLWYVQISDRPVHPLCSSRSFKWYWTFSENAKPLKVFQQGSDLSWFPFKHDHSDYLGRTEERDHVWCEKPSGILLQLSRWEMMAALTGVGAAGDKKRG